MDVVKVLKLLESLQFGRLTPPDKAKVRLDLKKAAISCMRDNDPLPTPLGWYVALMLEDHKPNDNAFIQVKDKTHMPASATKGTFAVAWSYDYLESQQGSH
jgi:hypothetical protein